MTHPDPRHSNDPERPAEAAPRAVDTGARPREQTGDVVHPEAAYGGADAIEKTSYVVGRGTEPSGKAGDTVNAHPPAGGGPNYLAWGIGALAALVAIFYLVSLIA